MAEGEDGRVAGDGAGGAANLTAREGLAGLQAGGLVAVLGLELAESLKVGGIERVGAVVLLGLLQLVDVAGLEGSEHAGLLAGLLGQRGGDDALPWSVSKQHRWCLVSGGRLTQAALQAPWQSWSGLPVRVPQVRACRRKGSMDSELGAGAAMTPEATVKRTVAIVKNCMFAG